MSERAAQNSTAAYITAAAMRQRATGGGAGRATLTPEDYGARERAKLNAQTEARRTRAALSLQDEAESYAARAEQAAARGDTVAAAAAAREADFLLGRFQRMTGGASAPSAPTPTASAMPDTWGTAIGNYVRENAINPAPTADAATMQPVRASDITAERALIPAAAAEVALRSGGAAQIAGLARQAPTALGRAGAAVRGVSRRVPLLNVAYEGASLLPSAARTLRGEGTEEDRNRAAATGVAALNPLGLLALEMVEAARPGFRERAGAEIRETPGRYGFILRELGRRLASY